MENFESFKKEIEEFKNNSKIKLDSIIESEKNEILLWEKINNSKFCVCTTEKDKIYKPDNVAKNIENIIKNTEEKDKNYSFDNAATNIREKYNIIINKFNKKNNEALQKLILENPKEKNFTIKEINELIHYIGQYFNDLTSIEVNKKIKEFPQNLKNYRCVNYGINLQVEIPTLYNDEAIKNIKLIEYKNLEKFINYQNKLYKKILDLIVTEEL
jgi:hypothetical protein